MAAAVEDQCAALGPDVVSELAGVELSSRAFDVGGLPACLWGDLGDVAVQVVRVGADVWATQLPGILEQVRSSGLLTEDELASMEEVADAVEIGDSVDPAQACVAFSDLLVADGQPAGTDLVVRIVPRTSDPQAISGQSCLDGVYASVLLVRPDLTASAEEAAAVRAAVETVVVGS